MFLSVDHRVVLTFEMLDFLIPTVASAGFRIEACRGSSFVEIDVGGGDSLKYCLDEDEAGAQHRQSVHGAVGRPRGRREASRRLDKMKYSMVPASSNHSRPGAASDIIKNNPDSKDKEDHWLEFVSSGNRLSVRFYSSRGRLLGRGMRAKFKIGAFLYYWALKDRAWWRRKILRRKKTECIKIEAETQLALGVPKVILRKFSSKLCHHSFFF